MKTFIKIVSYIVSLAAGAFVTYCTGKYVIMGLEVERGGSAMGGEIIMLLIIFSSVAYSVVSLLGRAIEEIDFSSMEL